VRAWYLKWRWITLERASGWLPWDWWHMRVCPFCHGYMKNRDDFLKQLRKAP
jgi:hypothetical protein